MNFIIGRRCSRTWRLLQLIVYVLSVLFICLYLIACYVVLVTSLGRIIFFFLRFSLVVETDEIVLRRVRLASDQLLLGVVIGVASVGHRVSCQRKGFDRSSALDVCLYQNSHRAEIGKLGQRQLCGFLQLILNCSSPKASAPSLRDEPAEANDRQY